MQIDTESRNLESIILEEEKENLSEDGAEDKMERLSFKPPSMGAFTRQ